MFSEVILKGQKQIIKMHVTDVTSHQWFSIPTTLQTVIIYAIKVIEIKHYILLKLMFRVVKFNYFFTIYKDITIYLYD